MLRAVLSAPRPAFPWYLAALAAGTYGGVRELVEAHKPLGRARHIAAAESRAADAAGRAGPRDCALLFGGGGHHEWRGPSAGALPGSGTHPLRPHPEPLRRRRWPLPRLRAVLLLRPLDPSAPVAPSSLTVDSLRVAAVTEVVANFDHYACLFFDYVVPYSGAAG